MYTADAKDGAFLASQRLTEPGEVGGQSDHEQHET